MSLSASQGAGGGWVEWSSSSENVFAFSSAKSAKAHPKCQAHFLLSDSQEDRIREEFKCGRTVVPMEDAFFRGTKQGDRCLWLRKRYAPRGKAEEWRLVESQDLEGHLIGFTEHVGAEQVCRFLSARFATTFALTENVIFRHFSPLGEVYFNRSIGSIPGIQCTVKMDFLIQRPATFLTVTAPSESIEQLRAILTPFHLTQCASKIMWLLDADAKALQEFGAEVDNLRQELDASWATIESILEGQPSGQWKRILETLLEIEQRSAK